MRRTCTCACIRAAWAALCVAGLVLAAVGQQGIARGAASGASYYSQAQAAAKHGDYRTAVSDYEQAILHGHNDPDSYYQLGLAFKQSKQLNYAEWAIAKALSDAVFSATTPSAVSVLTALEQGGAYDAGPPPAMNDAAMTAGTTKVSVPQLAQQEARSAFSVFQDPQQAYYVAPGFASKVSLADQGDIVQLADDASNSSNTVVKFVFLDATPAPYVRLADYAQDLLLRLDLQSGIVVVVTPQQAAAASNRLAGGAIASLVTQQLKRTGLNRPGLLAAGIGRTILQQANDNSRSSTIRSVIAAILVVLVVLAVLAFMIVRITRRAPLAHRQLQPPYASVAAHKRAR